MRQLAIIAVAWLALASNALGAMTLTYITTLSSATDASTYNFGNVTAASDGLLVCVVVSRSASSATVSSVSIGGTNGSLPVVNSGVTNVGAVATRPVSAGAHNVTVNFDQTMVRCGVGVYLLTGYGSSTPVHTAVSQGSTETNRVLTLNFPTNGIAVYGCFHGRDAANTTWSAATEDSDTSPEASAKFVFAHKTASGAGNNETVTWGVASNNVGVAAVFTDVVAAPVITTSGTQSLEESERDVVTMAATDGATPYVWSITGGDDAAFFAINSSTGALTMPGSADFENPEDTGANNVYEVEITVTDDEAEVDDLLVSVTVTDEGGGGAVDPLGGGPIP